MGQLDEAGPEVACAPVPGVARGCAAGSSGSPGARPPSPRPRASCIAAAAVASAHVGTSNAYFDGAAGPYGIRVIVRTPGVIPGLAQIAVRILSGEGVERVTVRPLRADVGLDGAPPPDLASLVRGETHLYSAELWLMTAGSYSVEVTVAGAEGEGTAFVPVLAVAERRLDMNRAVGFGLAGATLFLFVGAVTLFGAAVRESVLEPGVEPDTARRRRGRIAMAVGALLLGGVLGGGWTWWDAVDAEYRSRIYRPWSTASEIAMTGAGPVLTLTIDDPGWRAAEGAPGAALVPDHGKIMHLFLVKADDLAAFAHVHPAAAGEAAFTVPLPRLPPGDYRIFADIVHESGFAPTLVDTVRVPPAAGAAGVRRPAPGAPPPARPGPAPAALARDPDDSWAALRPYGTARSGAHALPSGRIVRWKRDAAIAADRETTLRFSVTEPDGAPSALEPYMGMLSHAAVLRDDGSVFVHLHPAGSINLTAQMRFARAAGAAPSAGRPMPGMRMAGAPLRAAEPANIVTFPFVFPQPGAWRVIVQVKVGGTVETAAFDVDVQDPAGS